MKKFIKSILGKRLSRLIVFYKNKEYMPFTFKSLVNPENIYSDFFVCNTKFFKNIFIAENTFSLLNLKRTHVIHQLNFYSKKGNFLESKIYKSKDYICKIELPKFNLNEEYISFTHESKIDTGNVKLKKNNFKFEYVFQHRGYSIFYKNKNSIGSIVHGNFGAITPSNLKNSAAIIRREKYSYTPIYIFKEKYLYHLVFNNPTKKKLKINIYGKSQNNNTEINQSIIIHSFGTEFFILKNFEGKLSFISKLPICRCIVVKNPDLNFESDFDIFHS